MRIKSEYQANKELAQFKLEHKDEIDDFFAWRRKHKAEVKSSSNRRSQRQMNINRRRGT